MEYNVRIVIPLHPEELDKLYMVLDKIAGRWGGCTVTCGHGYWNPTGTVDGENVVERQSVAVCDTSVSVLSPEAHEWWEDLAAQIAEDWDQECVFLSTTPQTAYLVDKAGMVRRIG